jgi:hypothetical protein
VRWAGLRGLGGCWRRGSEVGFEDGVSVVIVFWEWIWRVHGALEALLQGH